MTYTCLSGGAEPLPQNSANNAYTH